MSIFLEHPKFSNGFQSANGGDAKGMPVDFQSGRSSIMTESIFPKTESARDGLACIDAGRCNGFKRRRLSPRSVRSE